MLVYPQILLLILSVKPFPVWPLGESQASSSVFKVHLKLFAQTNCFPNWKAEFDSERVFTYRLPSLINPALWGLELLSTVACRSVNLRASAPEDKPSNPQLLTDVLG